MSAARFRRGTRDTLGSPQGSKVQRSSRLLEWMKVPTVQVRRSNHTGAPADSRVRLP